MSPAQPWGGLHPRALSFASPASRSQLPELLRPEGGLQLPYGLGRSYGDVCVLAGGRLILTQRLDRFLAADWHTGIIRAEAGLAFEDLLQVCVPRGWFVPVTPGTRFVTLGGAVANDIHGKNHVHVGSFGRHVRALGLVRSDQDEVTLSPDDPAGRFSATVGGLGLTGIITWVELQLQRIPSSYLATETFPLSGLDDYFRNAADSREWPFCVAWVDCLARGRNLGRGLFTRARWSETGGLVPHKLPSSLSVPMDAPAILLNRFTVGAFNQFYRRRPGALGGAVQHYSRFFHPLDSIGNWNRLYGRAGFFQHQSVIPRDAAPEALGKMLALTSARGLGSFLVVVKEFGSLPSPGLMSFPMEGTTIAMDFANRGELTEAIMRDLAEIAMAAGGRLYPAKDARMTAAQFRGCYPHWEQVERSRDPKILSDFWRRTALRD